MCDVRSLYVMMQGICIAKGFKLYKLHDNTYSVAATIDKITIDLDEYGGLAITELIRTIRSLK